MIQQGRILIRKVSSMDLRANSSVGVNRMDLSDELHEWQNEAEITPLPLTAFQSYRYQNVPFQLSLTATLASDKLKSETQMIVRASLESSKFESRIVLTENKPIYRVELSVENNWILSKPSLSVPFDWSIDLLPDGMQKVDIRFATGQPSPLPIVLLGELQNQGESLPLPHITVQNAETQTGHIVIQSERSVDAVFERFQGSRKASSRIDRDWLNPLQRSISKLATRFRDTNFNGKVVLIPKKAIVNGMAVSNVKVTELVIEETVLMEWDIRDAGINRVIFDLPEWMKNATVKAPLVKKIDRRESPRNKELIQFTVDLQEE